MNRICTATLAAVFAAILAGCTTYDVGILRYSGGGPSREGIHARGLAYTDCALADNSSFEAVDACMARSGYQRKDR